MRWLFDLPLQPDIDVSDTTTGVPVWVLLLAIVISAAGGALTAWVTRRRDRSSSEQQMIDQLQEQVHTLTGRVERLDAQLYRMQTREIAWITYTSDLTRVALEAGGKPPPMPIELRTAPTAVAATA